MNRADLEQWKAREVARLLALLETERRYYQEIVASAPVGFLIVSPDLGIVSSNRELRQLFGLRQGDPLRWHLDSFLPSWVIGKIEEVLGSGTPQYRMPLNAPGAPDRDLLLSIQPLRSWDDSPETEALVTIEQLPSGTPVKAVERKHTENIPAADEVLQNLDAIVWVLELPSKRFRYVSEKAQELLGFPVEFWLDAPSFWEDRIHPEDREWVVASYERAIENWVRHSCEYRARTSHSRPVWLRETARLLQDAEGNATALVGVAVEVTERRLLEEQFVRSQRFDTLSRFSGRIADEIGNPAAVLAGYVEERLRSLPPDSAERSGFREISAAAGRLRDITRQLTATLTPSAPAVPLDLGALLTRLEPEFKAALPGSEVELKLFPARVGVCADSGQLSGILKTLLERARRSMPHGGKVIVECAPCEIEERPHRLGATLKPGVYGCVSIEDDGNPLDAEARARLFESMLPAKPENGEGPALARAYAAVRQWGGDILVLAVDPRGTNIQIFLPRTSEMPEPLAEPVAKFAAPEPEPPSALQRFIPEAAKRPEPDTVLVVDEEAGIRNLVRKILQQQGYRVLEAGSAAEASRVCEQHAGEIRLAIADLTIPAEELRGMLERLRELSPGMKFIIVPGTAEERPSDPGSFPDAAFLSKPFTLGSLVNKAKELLG